MAEAERIKPRSMYVEEAIQLALESRWAEALTVNQALIERHGGDEDAYNRLGKAHTEMGNLQEAWEAYSKSLQLNPLNVIAQKNTHKLASLIETREAITTAPAAAIDVDAFAEEPGKSMATLLRAPDQKVTVTVVPGDVVELRQAEGELEARTGRGAVLGAVDAKIGRRLVALMETGNRYTAAVAHVDETGIEIVIREVFQSAENAGKSSFPSARPASRASEFRPYAKDSLLDHRGSLSATLDDEEAEDDGEVEAIEDEGELAGMQTTEDFDDAADSLGDDSEDSDDLGEDLEADDNDDEDEDDDY